MGGSMKLYILSIEGMEITAYVVAYTVEDAIDTVKQWLNPGVEVKLLDKQVITFGKQFKEQYFGTLNV